MSFLSNIFRRKEKELPADFVNPIKVDLHSHYLPGIDDGCKEIGESIEILKILESKGYTKAVTTPHVMSDFYKNSPEIINTQLELVHDEMKKAGLTIKLEAAAEYYVDDNFIDKVLKRNILSFGIAKYVLIETGFLDMPMNLLSAIFELKTSGYIPVLAHPERYQYFIPGTDDYEQIVGSGVLFQMNLLSIIGYYNPQAKKVAEHLIQNQMVNFVGGDTHNMKHLWLVQEKAVKHPLYGKVVELPLLNNSL